MGNISVAVILIGCWLTLATCEPSIHGSNHIRNSLLDTGDSETVDGFTRYSNNIMDNMMDKRGRQSYTSSGSEAKRLPVLNFGLGKRAVPYSFGLGKRTDFENGDNDDYEAANNDEKLYGLLEAYYNIKRNRPYSFGLGKRDPINEEKRRFDFGLGKRTMSDEERQYNFGIGKRVGNYDGPPYDNIKRVRPYSYASRTRDPMYGEKRRFDFGLGKRTMPYEERQFNVEKSEAPLTEYNSGIAKREAQYDGPPYGFGLGKRETQYNVLPNHIIF